MSEKIVQLDLFSDKNLTDLEKAKKGIRGLFARIMPLKAAMLKMEKDLWELDALVQEIDLENTEKQAHL